MTFLHPPKLFPRDKVEKIAAEMAAGDPDWTYTVKHDPKGGPYSLILIHDEDGEFVAHVA